MDTFQYIPPALKADVAPEGVSPTLSSPVSTSSGPKQRVSPVVLPPARGGSENARAAINRLVAGIGPALGNVFLISNPWIGLLFWVAIAHTPRLAGFALLGLAIAVGGLRLLGIEDEPRVGGSLRSNVILATIAAGWMTAPTIYPLQVQVAIAVAVGSVTFVVSSAVLSLLRSKNVPPLLWGYAVTAGAMFALFPVGTALAAQHFTWWMADVRTPLEWTATFFRSLGSLMFAPSVGAGIIVGAAILLWSRAAFAAGLVGWLAGTFVAIGVQDLGIVFHWLPAAHNFFVAGMALGAYFILPGCWSLPIAALAGAGASVCSVILQTFVPAFAYLPLASGMTIWLVLGMLSLAADRRGFWRNRNLDIAPEEGWWREFFWSQRIGRNEPLVIAPVQGTVEIAQGFDGSLSHTAGFRHALDFVRPQSLHAANAGNASIWNAPVTAPAAGVVESVRNDIADNPIGVCNFAENWGNHVCIRLDQGGWALLAHFRQWSIVVRPGMRVEIGTYLGVAGNSGRSPVPHVHMQVQRGPELGAQTMPFRLANFQSGTRLDGSQLEWNAAAVPAENALILAAVPNPSVHSMLASFAPGSGVWSVEMHGTLPRAFRERGGNAGIPLVVTLDAWGRHRFACGRGRLLALAAPDAWRVLEQVGDVPLLKLLALAAPSVPYAAQAGMCWSDMAPLIPDGMARWTRLPFAPCQAHPFVYTRTTCTIAPTSIQDYLKLETVVAARGRSLPSRIVCTFDRIRGATTIEVTFDKGSVTYTLQTFTPGPPF